MPTMTQGDIIRAGGAYPLRNSKFVFSEDAFRRTFSVGDLIRFGPTATGRVTSLGEKRFLFKVTTHNGTIDR